MRLKIPILIIILSGLTTCYSCDEKPSEQAKDIRWEKYATVIQDPNKEIILPDVSSGFTFTTYHQIGAYALFLHPSPVHLISMESGNHILTIKGHPLSTQSISFSPDGKKILTGGTDNVVRLWDITTGEQLGQAKEHSDIVRSVAYSPVGESALSGGDDRIILLWDLEKMQVIKRFTGHTSGIRHRCLVFSKDGKSFLSGNWDGTIRLWDVESGQALVRLQAELGRVMSIALSPDGKYALSSYLSGEKQPVIFWDLGKQKEINRFGVPGNPWFADQRLHVASVAFSPDGKTALFGLVFGTVLWWDLDKWEQIAHNRLYTKELEFVTFSQDGKSVISVGKDKKLEKTGKNQPNWISKVKFWQLPTKKY